MLWTTLLQVRDSLHQRAQDFGIVLEDVAITHLSFSQEVRSDSHTTACLPAATANRAGQTQFCKLW